ncbi:MAG: nucleoside hydrolase, partial [Deltaproteobacteria bacterium]|nr:nucleoside hydrolase [Deltaproteobacteria bacterium]
SDRYLEDVTRPVRSEAALDLVKKAMASSPENPLYVATVGCITNIASAILVEPEIIRNIIIVWLGGNGLNWPHQKEFNLMQDVLAARVILDSGVPIVIMPCQPVISHFHTTIQELEYYMRGKNKVSDYLLDSTIDYSGGHDTWSKVVWDVTAVAWLVNPQWIPTTLEHSPVLTDQVTYSTDHSRHLIRMATSINRDAIFRDLFRKLTR